MRALREPVTVIFALLFAPAFIRCMGLIFGNNPVPEFGGKGFLEANFTAFPGIVIAISALIIVPVDLVTQRGRESCAAFAPPHSTRPSAWPPTLSPV